MLKIHFERAASRLRWLSPGGASVVRDYLTEIEQIEARPGKEIYVAGCALLARLDRWIKDGARPPAPPPAPVVPVPVAAAPAPSPPPPIDAPAAVPASPDATIFVPDPGVPPEEDDLPDIVFSEIDGVPIPPEDAPTPRAEAL